MSVGCEQKQINTKDKFTSKLSSDNRVAMFDVNKIKYIIKSSPNKPIIRPSRADLKFLY